MSVASPSQLHLRFPSLAALRKATEESADSKEAPRLRLCVREGIVPSDCEFAMPPANAPFDLLFRAPC